MTLDGNAIPLDIAAIREQFLAGFAKPDIDAPAAKGGFVRRAVIGSAKMLRSLANVRLGEAAPQNRNSLPTSGKGREHTLTIS